MGSRVRVPPRSPTKSGITCIFEVSAKGPVSARCLQMHCPVNGPLPDEGESHKKSRPVAAIHYRKRSDSFQSRHKAGVGNRRVAMASCRSKVRVAVRALVKT